MLLLGGMAVAQKSFEELPEQDHAVLARVSQWQDLKFGLMVHWGIYSQKGIVESWSICPEEWVPREKKWSMDYVHEYWTLSKRFNPTKFKAEQWTKAAKNAGMKYMVMTAKHHDGFCMFNTEETDFNIVKSGFGRDVIGEVVNACKKDSLWSGIYFSKPDWHHSDYWTTQLEVKDRNVKYNPEKYPDKWQNFCDYTYNQVRELTHNYGDIDILWLDGEWVRPEWSLDEQSRLMLGENGWVQDIGMPHIATMARDENEDLLIVDRSVHGRYENYRILEKEIPNRVLPYPWEACMTIGDSWSYRPNDNYKSATKLIHILVDVVAKGGNLLLNVGADAKGYLPLEALDVMSEMGIWLQENGEAIYNTRPYKHAVENNWRFTQSKDGDHMYMIYLVPEGYDNETINEVLPIYAKEWAQLKVLAGGKIENHRGEPYLLQIPSGKNRHAVVVDCTRRGIKK